jgi:sortase A
VGFPLPEARVYQFSAKQCLENEIQAEKEHPQSPATPPVRKGDVLGRMDIPRFGMSVVVLPGTRSQILRLGIGYFAGIPLPGETGNVGIAGHRDTFFRGLKDIGKNDEIQLQTASGL